jgi:hypothetical protein|tara:strand:+ start:267 stop:536 length:270 start_codon:yes stop_codon:yes gene_type:complete
MRAKTVIHVEYEILKHILENVDVSRLRGGLIMPEEEATSEVKRKKRESQMTRFQSGGENVLGLIRNLADRRKHRLPQEHEDYHAKEASE